MGALLIFKMIIPPYLVVTSIQRIGAGDGEKVCMLAGLTLVCMFCLYQVVDEGSWLDIGLGISHFVIANFLSLISLVALFNGRQPKDRRKVY
jgi:phosphatidylinositol glycan class N